MARRPITIRCTCCGLARTAWDIDGEAPPTICGKCLEHRAVNHRERKALEHEAMLREALYAASKSARDAYAQRDSYRDKMRAAYRGRERVLRHLDKIAAMHSMRGDGGCSCGMRRGCRVGALVSEPWVQREIAKLEARDRAQARELGYADPPDDDWLVDAWDRIDPPAAPRQSAIRPRPNSRRRPA